MGETMARKEDGSVSLTEIVVQQIQSVQDAKKQEYLLKLTQELEKEVESVQKEVAEWRQAGEKTVALAERAGFTEPIKDFLESGLSQKIKEKQFLLDTLILAIEKMPAPILDIKELAKLPGLSTAFVYEITQIRSALAQILNLQDFIAEGHQLFLQKKADLAVGLTKNSIRHFLMFLIDLSKPKQAMYAEMFSSLLESTGGAMDEEESVEVKIYPVLDLDGDEEDFVLADLDSSRLNPSAMDRRDLPFSPFGSNTAYLPLSKGGRDISITKKDEPTGGSEPDGDSSFEANEVELLVQKYLELKAAKHGVSVDGLSECRDFAHEVLYKIADAQNKSGPFVSRECFLGNGNSKAFSSEKVNRANNLVARKVTVRPNDEEKPKFLAFVKANILILWKIDNLTIDVPEKSAPAATDGDENRPSLQSSRDLDKKTEPITVQKKRRKGSIIIDWDNFDKICEQTGTDRSKAKALDISNSYFCTLKQKRQLEKKKQGAKLLDDKKIDPSETPDFGDNDNFYTHGQETKEQTG